MVVVDTQMHGPNLVIWRIVCVRHENLGVIIHMKGFLR